MFLLIEIEANKKFNLVTIVFSIFFFRFGVAVFYDYKSIL